MNIYWGKSEPRFKFVLHQQTSVVCLKVTGLTFEWKNKNSSQLKEKPLIRRNEDFYLKTHNPQFLLHPIDGHPILNSLKTRPMLHTRSFPKLLALCLKCLVHLLNICWTRLTQPINKSQLEAEAMGTQCHVNVESSCVPRVIMPFFKKSFLIAWDECTNFPP